MTPRSPARDRRSSASGRPSSRKAAGRTEPQLAREAIVAACADAGLTPADVDGLVSYTIDPVEETELVRAVGLRRSASRAASPTAAAARWAC